MLLCQSAIAQTEGSEPAIAMGGRGVQGTVTAVNGSTITLKAPNGESLQVATSPNTTIRHGRDPIRLADIHPGEGVGAMGEVDPATHTVHALYVTVVDAAELKKMKEDLGKTYIAGKVTSIDELRLTILRPDGVSQTIAVDEDTSFKRGGRGMGMLGGMGGGPRNSGQGGGGGAQGGFAGGPGAGESITLADIKTGDSVAGQGTLKAGVFVPTQLFVGDPASHRHRERTQPAGTVAEPRP